VIDLPERPGWVQFAACRGLPADAFHPAPGASTTTNRIRELCRACAVPEACASYSMSLDPPAVGIWAGLGSINRRHLRHDGYLRLDDDELLHEDGQVVIVRGPRPLPDVVEARAALIANLRNEPPVKTPPAPTAEQIARAEALGLTPANLDRLRSLIAEATSVSWALGDLLVDLYGTPTDHGYHDGTRVLFDRLADELGVTVSVLVHARLTAAAWPSRERRPVSFTVHRDLRALPGRFALLRSFMADCEREGVTASDGRLPAWLHAHAAGAVSLRPRLDPIERLTRAALALDHDALVRLIERLTAALAASAVAA